MTYEKRWSTIVKTERTTNRFWSIFIVTAHRPGLITNGDGMFPVAPDTVTNVGVFVGFNCTFKRNKFHGKRLGYIRLYLHGIFTINFCSMLMLFGVSGVIETNPNSVSLLRLTYFNTIL